MKKGDIFEGIVDRTEFPNKGIVFIEEPDCKVLVKNVLPGQRIRFQITKKKKGKPEGRLLEVIEPAANEQPSGCIHFGSCGGCRYQNLSYPDQLALKRSQVEELIRKAGFEFPIEDIYGSPTEYGYRNKMEYTFGDEYKDGPLALGMHKKNSFYDIVPISGCRIVNPDFNVIVQTVLAYFRGLGATFYHRIRHEGYLRHLVLRRSVKTGDILVNLVTSSQGELDEEEFVERLLSLEQEDPTADSSNETGAVYAGPDRVKGRIVGILHTINDSVADVVKSDETRILYGEDYFYEYLFGQRFKISPFSFFLVVKW